MKSGFKRVYAKNGRWWYVDLENKWHSLSRIEDGKAALARAVHAHVPSKATLSTLSGAIGDFRKKEMPATLSATYLKDTEYCLGRIEAAFSAFPSAAEIEAVDVERFLDQWSGNPTSQRRYRGLVIRIFRRAVLRGDCKYNPAREVPEVVVPRRKRYVEDDELVGMIEHALAPPTGRCVNGDRHALIFKLAYLTGQRLTDIRLLRKADVAETAIYFQPTKTRTTTAPSINVPITPAIRAVLKAAARLKVSAGVESLYVVPMRDGRPYGAGTLSCAWARVRQRAGLKDLLARDLRSKALSDGEAKQGLDLGQLQKAGTHANAGMTLRYLRNRPTGESPLRLEMPRRRSV